MAVRAAADNVRETFTNTGTVIQLGGAAPDSRAISAVYASGDVFPCVARKGAEISVGMFTYTAGAPGTVAQTTVKYSSNGNAAVSFTAGTGEIYSDIGAFLVDILNLAEQTLASAATFDIGSVDALRVAASGTTGPVTSLGTAANEMRIVRWAGAALTHNATSLILLGGVSRTTIANAIGIYISDASGNWRELFYQTPNGEPAAAPTGSIVDRAYAEYTTNADLTATIPGDDTIPQNTEGTQILSASITPKSTTNRVRARFMGCGTTVTAPNGIVVSLFRSGGANALRTVHASVDTAGFVRACGLEFEDVPGSTSAQTYTVRVGPTTGTMRMNGFSTGRLFGGTEAATLVLEEIKA